MVLCIFDKPQTETTWNGLDALQFAADFTVNCNGASGNDSVNGNPDIDFVSQKIIINTGVQKNTVM